MDREVAWSPEALDDVEAIAEYIERNSAFYAQAVATAILEMARSIGRFPWMGRVVPEMGSQNIGERFVYSYRVTYELQEGRILIRDSRKAPHREHLRQTRRIARVGVTRRTIIPRSRHIE